MTLTPTETPTPTISETLTPTPTATPTVTPTITPSVSMTAAIVNNSDEAKNYRTPTPTKPTPTPTNTPTQAPVSGLDGAGNYLSYYNGQTYPGNQAGFESGVNRGYGFGAWSVTKINNGFSDALAYVPGGMADIRDSTGKVWSLRAFDANNNSILAYRSMNQNLPEQCALQFTIAAAWRNGKKGFNLFREDGSFIFNFEISNDRYYFNGTEWTIPYGANSAFDLFAYRTPGTNNLFIRISRRFAGSEIIQSSNFTGPLRTIQFYNENTSSSDDSNLLLFSSLKYEFLP